MAARALARAAWTAAERRVFERLTTPAAIQAFLDRLPYSADPIYRCPRTVLRDRKAHCFDGALFAAAALRRLGHPPRILDLFAENDDDHLLALFQVGGLWGAVAKSNFVGLRYREPIHRTLRELVMSYFEDYYNAAGQKTLRFYTAPLDLRRFDRLGWMTDDAPLEAIAQATDRLRRYPLLTPAMARRLLPVDRRSFESGMLGTDPAGLYRPRRAARRRA